MRDPVKVRKTGSDPAVGVQEALAFPGHVALKGEAEQPLLAWPFLAALLRHMRQERLEHFLFSVSAERLSSHSLAHGLRRSLTAGPRVSGQHSWAKSFAEVGNPAQLFLSLPPHET